jgi:hypothetical protein
VASSGPQGEVVDDQQVDADEPAELCLEGIVQAGGAESGEQPVGAGGLDGEPSADRNVSQRVGQVRLADADRFQEQGVVAGFDEPQRCQVESNARS